MEYKESIAVEHQRVVNKVLNIRPNSTIQISDISLLLYTATCFGYPDQPSSGECRINKNGIKGERLLFTVVQIITILYKKEAE
jgi:hypothetical protein